MACFKPLRAYQSSDGHVSFRELKDTIRRLELPCGQCIGCRLERSRQWAIRCMHEAQLYEHNSFVTLTYEVAPLSLDYRDFQLFMKRLRKKFKNVRFFMCGEYGEDTTRPHFHVCLFNCYFADRSRWSRTAAGYLFRSKVLEELWPHGFSLIGDVTFESAAYVARYITKKVTGDAAAMHYAVVDPSTGEFFQRVPEFCHMSLKPGIGARWFEKYRSDIYPDGRVVMRGVQMRPPKYYDRKFAKADPDGMADLAMRREVFGKSRFEDNSDERLAVKEQVTLARVSQLKRS